jgi:uncharacterized protein YndB with AHSA1/START domain
MIIDDDRIEKVTELAAPVSRVWRALTDHVEFGQWFKVQLDQPFTPGGRSTGRMTEPGREGAPWLAIVERIEPERLFAYRWHDYDPVSKEPLSDGPTTLVEFRLEPIEGGTRLTITETGFSQLAEPRRLEAMRSNNGGWDMQAERIARHVAR